LERRASLARFSGGPRFSTVMLRRNTALLSPYPHECFLGALHHNLPHDETLDSGVLMRLA
jgi:hypothetical protein